MVKTLVRKARTFIFYWTPIGECLNGLYDISHHQRYSFKEKNLSKQKAHLRYFLTKYYHIVEKGLALPEPRPGFGQKKINKLIDKATIYENTFGTDSLTRSIRKTLLQYLEFNKNINHDLPDSFQNSLQDFINQPNDIKKMNTATGGLKIIDKSSLTNINIDTFRNFSSNRVSVRDFSDEEISDNTIESIINIAQSTPSVCNRQAWKVHIYSKKEDIISILSYQNGNAGFTDKVNKLLIVTADIRGFTSFESNQPYIDGGLFSMSLLYAIHASGLGSCPLNTCYPYYIEKRVKQISRIPSNERLIMMIAVGGLKDNFKVAYSTRNSLSEVLTKHTQIT